MAKAKRAVCRNCKQRAASQSIQAAPGYEELSGGYCAGCITDALVLLRQAKECPDLEVRLEMEEPRFSLTEVAS